MSKILRKTSKLFASTAGGNDIGVFGSLAAGSPAYSTDPAVIQSLSNFLTGWAAETIATRRPAYQDFNALDFLTFYQLGYIFQAGVAEWDAGTTYYTGSIVNDGTGVLYKSLVDNNLNNAVSDGTKWALVVTPLVINTLTEKTVPVDADLILIEDSAAGNAQKKVQLVNATGMMKVQTGTVSTVSSFTISSLVAGAKYKLVFNFNQNTANGVPTLRFNADSGANYKWSIDYTTYKSNADTSITMAVVAWYVGEAHGEINIQPSYSSNNIALINFGTLHTYPTSPIDVWGGGSYSGAAPITSLTLLTSAGTISGTWSLYKLS